jgi:hypothetical protein
MSLKRTCVAVAFLAVFPISGYSQDAKPGQNPDPPLFKMEVVGDVMADFSARVTAYAELRSRLIEGVPALTVNDPAEVRKSVQALAAKIRVARAGARRGDIFTPAISREMMKVLDLQMNRSTWADLVDDNPGEFAKRVNGSYPEGRPFSTVPANMLAVLPSLPPDLEYRFVGPDLGLLDTRANVIVDWLPFAIQCAASDDKSKCHR